jgi:hypothetical protein
MKRKFYEEDLSKKTSKKSSCEEILLEALKCGKLIWTKISGRVLSITSCDQRIIFWYETPPGHELAEHSIFGYGYFRLNYEETLKALGYI